MRGESGIKPAAGSEERHKEGQQYLVKSEGDGWRKLNKDWKYGSSNRMKKNLPERLKSEREEDRHLAYEKWKGRVENLMPEIDGSSWETLPRRLQSAVANNRTSERSPLAGATPQNKCSPDSMVSGAPTEPENEGEGGDFPAKKVNAGLQWHARKGTP